MNLYDFINKHFDSYTNPVRFSIILNDDLKNITDKKELEYIENLKRFKLFRLLQNISNIIIKINKINYNTEFITWITGKEVTTFTIECISDNDLKLLEETEIDILPLSLKAFIAHIISHRKNYNNCERYIKLAIDSYILLLDYIIKDNFNLYTIFEARDIIVFVLNLANHLTKHEEKEYCYRSISEFIEKDITNETLINELIPIKRHFNLFGATK